MSAEKIPGLRFRCSGACDQSLCLTLKPQPCFSVGGTGASG